MRLYIADDNQEFAAFCAQVARQAGWIVTVCHNGQQLVTALQDEGSPALLLIDIQMPELDGIETVEALTQLDGVFRIRFITGGPSSAAMAARMIAEARDLDVGRFLTKPIGVSELREMLSAEETLFKPPS